MDEEKVTVTSEEVGRLEDAITFADEVEELELETLEAETLIVEADMEAPVIDVASRERAHAIKVAKFLAGGKF